MNNSVQHSTVPDTARLVDAIMVINANRNRCAVVTSGDKIVGMISEGDLMRALLAGCDIHAPLADWINYSFKFLPTRDEGAALQLMREFGITMVPIVDDNFHLADVITLNDILAHVALQSAR